MGKGINQRVATEAANEDLPEVFTSAWASVLLDLHEKDQRPVLPAEAAEAWAAVYFDMAEKIADEHAGSLATTATYGPETHKPDR